MEDARTSSARCTQAAISLALLLLLIATCAATDMVARNRTLERWSQIESRSLADRNNTVFSNTGNFVDQEERVLLDEIPRADYSKGGVYFFGSSNMKWAFQTWDLPEEERSHVGNYGIGAFNHGNELQLIRYLIERRGFLQAGERDLVLLGVSFHLAHVDGASGGIWAALLKRRGLFTEADDGSVEPVPMPSLWRWLKIEQARCAGLFWNTGHLFKAWLVDAFGGRHPVVHNGEQYRRGWREFMGQRWQQNIDDAVSDLKKVILLVQSHGARVKVVLLPQGSWMKELPFGARYTDEVRQVCDETGTTTIDLSEALADQDFVDSNHLTVKGQQRFRELLMGEIRAK